MMMKIGMPHFLRRRPRFNRSFQRIACQIDTELTLIDRMISFEGRIIDISRGGAMFRPKLAYIMYRADVPVCIHIGNEELFGQIVSTSPVGFSIRFDEPVEEELFESLLVQAGISVKQAA